MAVPSVIHVDSYTGTDDQKIQAAITDSKTRSDYWVPTTLVFEARVYTLNNPLVLNQATVY